MELRKESPLCLCYIFSLDANLFQLRFRSVRESLLLWLHPILKHDFFQTGSKMCLLHVVPRFFEPSLR